MVNLLPPEELAKLNIAYRRRRLVVAGMLLFVWLVLVTISSGSFAILLRQDRTALEKNLALADMETVAKEWQKANTEWQGDLEKAQTLAQPDPVAFTFVLRRLAVHQPEEVKLVGLNYQRQKDERVELGLRGVTATRQALLVFTEAIKTDPAFLEVKSPPANLIKEQGAEFTLTVTAISRQEE